MKNRRLAIILSIFAIITLLVTLSSTVFIVNKIEINWTTSLNVFSLNDNEKIINSGNLNKNTSIFLVNKNEFINNLEKNNPYIKIVNVETVFPNKLVIHAGEREVLFALKVTDSANNNNYNYILLDKDLKVLEKTTANIVPSTTSPIIVEIENSTLTDLNFEVGEIKDIDNALKTFGKNLESLNYNNLQAKALIKNFVLQFGTRKEVTLLTNWGITIKIEDCDNDYLKKLQHGFSVYNYLHDSNPPINSGTIIVFKNASGEIQSSYLNN